MKKLNISVLTILTLILLSFISKTEQYDTPPNFIKTYIDSLSRTVAYKEIPDYVDKPCPEYITKEQAREDIEMFKYLIKTAYSGKAYWEKQGVDFSVGSWY